MAVEPVQTARNRFDLSFVMIEAVYAAHYVVTDFRILREKRVHKIFQLKGFAFDRLEISAIER